MDKEELQVESIHTDYAVGVKQARNKEERLLYAAAQIFSQKGFHEATIEEIAAAAGVGKGTVYLYFPSKEALFFRVISYGQRLYLHQVQALLEKEEAAPQVLQQLIIFHLDFVGAHANLVRMSFMELHSGPEAQRFHAENLAQHQRQRELFIQFIQRGQEAGYFRRDIHPVIAFLTLEGVLNSLAMEQLLAKGEAGLDPKIITELILTGLQGEKKK